MARDLTRVSATMPVLAEKAYAVIADYRAHHPHILPKPPFVGLAVVEGGVGAGTAIDVTVRTLRGTRVLHMRVSEPEPGRVLEERADDGTVTRFTVEPVAAEACRVTLETRWPTKRLLRNLVLRRTYMWELTLLEEYAKTMQLR